MTQQPSNHNKVNTTTGNDPPAVAQHPVPSLQRESSHGFPEQGKPRRTQIRRLIWQCRLWLIEHSLSFHLAHSASVEPPPQLWIILELRNESERRRIRRVPSRSIEGSGPIVIPEIIEREVLRHGVPW
jgi:hypothetical protein